MPASPADSDAGRFLAARSWVPGAGDGGFPLQSLPYGIFSTGNGPARVGVAIGDHIVDLAALGDAGVLEADCPGAGAVFAQASLNAFMARGRPTWSAVRRRLAFLLAEGEAGAADREAVQGALVERRSAVMHQPFEVADYVDFYSSVDHATNVGRMLRPGADPLPPNWRHLPLGYHGRAGTVVVSGTPVRRPAGQRRLPDGRVVFGLTERLDFELEVGFVIGRGSDLGRPVPAAATAEHVFGVVLVNDWSARDIQAWEYQPLGPFLGKSFATSISAWVVPLEALLPVRVPPPRQDPPPLPYLHAGEPWAFDLDLEVWLSAGGDPAQRISAVNFSGMYWTIAQQLAHTTVNGARLRTGDLLASGTVSGPAPAERGCLIERTWNGTEPLELPGGGRRTFLEDGDEVVLRGSCDASGVRFELGEVRGRVIEPGDGRPGGPAAVTLSRTWEQ